jgi:hypothetical protein
MRAVAALFFGTQAYVREGLPRNFEYLTTQFCVPASGRGVQNGQALGGSMPYDLPLRCRCGHVRGVACDVSPSLGFRLFCYCKDCQAFARILARPDVLDAAGGTDIFQMPPGRLRFSAGGDALRCLCFSEKVLRWYADCCKTPIANGAATPRFPLIGLIHSFMDFEGYGYSRDEVLGLPLCRIHEQSAVAPPPADAPPPARLGIFAYRAAKVLGWWMRGLGRPNPLFDHGTGAPLTSPRVVTPTERAAL